MSLVYTVAQEWRLGAALVLAFLCLYQATTLAILIRFHRHFRKEAWKPVTYPSNPDHVADPIYRLVSRLRVRFPCCKEERGRKPVIDRPRGKFGRPPADVKEPARTERLLDQPVNLFRANAADMLDVIGFPLMARSSGASFIGLSFEYLALTGQMLVGVLCGLDALLEPGSDVARAQLWTVALVQLTLGTFILKKSPSADRLMSILVGTQFILEGIMTLFLIVQEFYGYSAHSAFACALASVLAPVVQRIYDATIVQVSKIVRKEGFTWKGACFACVGCIVFLPSVVAKFAGLNPDEDANLKTSLKFVEGAGDDVNKLATKTANEGVIRQIEHGIGEVATNMFWVVSQERATRREKNVTEAAKAFKALRHTSSSSASEPSNRASSRRCQVESSSRGGGGSSVRSETSTEISKRPGLSWLREREKEMAAQEKPRVSFAPCVACVSSCAEPSEQRSDSIPQSGSCAYVAQHPDLSSADDSDCALSDSESGEPVIVEEATEAPEAAADTNGIGSFDEGSALRPPHVPLPLQLS